MSLKHALKVAAEKNDVQGFIDRVVEAEHERHLEYITPAQMTRITQALLVQPLDIDSGIQLEQLAWTIHRSDRLVDALCHQVEQGLPARLIKTPQTLREQQGLVHFIGGVMGLPKNKRILRVHDAFGRAVNESMRQLTLDVPEIEPSLRILTSLGSESQLAGCIDQDHVRKLITAIWDNGENTGWAFVARDLYRLSGAHPLFAGDVLDDADTRGHYFLPHYEVIPGLSADDRTVVELSGHFDQRAGAFWLRQVVHAEGRARMEQLPLNDASAPYMPVVNEAFLSQDPPQLPWVGTIARQKRDELGLNAAM